MVDRFGGHSVCLRRFSDCAAAHIFDRRREFVRLAVLLRGRCSSRVRIHFASGTLAWHAFIAALYGLAAINLLVNPLLGVVLLALIIGLVLITEGIIEILLFFVLREYRHVVWILIDGLVTLVLGIVVCAHWPPANLEFVQYLVGISFISSGISRLLLGFAIRVVEPTETLLRQHERIR